MSRNILPILFLLAPLLVTGCDKTANLTEQEHIQRAKDFEAKGDLQSATIELKSAAEKNPRDAQAHWLLGLLYLKIGDGASAEKGLRRARELGVKVESTLIPLGQAYLLQQQYDKVLSNIQATPGASPKDAARVMQLHADAMLGLKRVEEGCALFEKSLTSDPDNQATYWGLAKCAIAKQDLKKAKALLGSAMKLDPRNPKTHIYLAEVEDIGGNRDAALAAYSEALKLDPGNTDAFSGRAFIFIAKGDLAAAEKEIAAVRKARPGLPLVNYLQALLDYHQKKYQQAQTQLEEVLRSAPNHLPSLRLSAAIAYHLGQYEQAERSANRVLGWLPGDTYMRKLLADIMLKTGRGAEAGKVLQPLLGSKQIDPESLLLAGNAAILKRDFGEAAKYYQQAVSAQPQDVPARIGLGMSRLAAGEQERAIAELEQAARQSRNDTRADMTLVLTHLRLKDYAAALTAIHTLEAKRPNAPEVAVLLGLAQLGMGDRGKAREAFQRAFTQRPDYVLAAMMLAQMDVADGKPQLAEKRMQELLSHDSKNLTAMLSLAGLARGRKDEAGYLGWLEKASKANPTAPEPPTLLAENSMKKGQLDTALSYARQAQTAAPNNADAVLMLGRAQMAAKQPEAAIASFNRLTSLRPAAADPYFFLATAQMAKGDRNSAKTSLDQAVKIQPDHPDALAALAGIEAQGGNTARALEIASRLQRQHPASPTGATLQGDILMTQKRHGEAAQAYAKAMRISASGALAAKLHDAQILAGKIAEADVQLQQWLKDHPDDARTRAYLAQSYLSRNLFKEAAGQYESILQQVPNQVMALNNLAAIYQRLGDPRALDAAQRALRQAPDSAFTMDTLGWILATQGKLDEGLGLLEKAHARAPKNPEIWYHYANALAKSGDKNKARAELRALLKLPQPAAQKQLATALLGQL
jgi:putative PEP-CTERM system TPR-repeat lipoprotein